MVVKKAGSMISDINSDSGQGGDKNRDAVQRARQYIAYVAAGDVEGLFKALLDDMDKENIMAEVKEMRAKHPDLSARELSAREINTTAKAMSGVAIGSGLSWVLPGVALLTGPLATAGEIIGLFVFQSRLVVKIAAYHGMDITSEERVRDIAVCVASSSASVGGSKLTGKAMEAAVRQLGKKMTQMAGRKAVQSGAKSLPGVGALAGLLGGAVGAVSNYYAVKGVGLYALKMYGGDLVIPYEEVVDRFDKAIIYVTILTMRADGVVTEEEQQQVESLVRDCAVDEQTRKELLAKLHGPLSIADICGDFLEEEKKELIITAVKVAMKDRNINADEHKFINELAMYLNLPLDYVANTMQRYAEALLEDFSGRGEQKLLTQEEAKDNPFVIHL